jgi:hypothetical protein
MSQNTLWQTNKQNNDFAELCNALYEREIHLLANIEGRLKSLPYYINRTANKMVNVNELGLSPLTLDVQNATWSAKQASKLSVLIQPEEDVHSWYLALINQTKKVPLGLPVPILRDEHIFLDSIDGIDTDKKRIRTNVSGWFSLKDDHVESPSRLLKPTKKVMLAACAGHQWQDQVNTNKLRPVIPSMRELLISCAIDWQNFKRPLAL